MNDAIRDSETLTADDLSVRIGAAKEESAPAAEQRVKVLFDGLNLIRSRALLDGHTEFYRIADEAIDASRAPAPAQDKPVAASVDKERLEEAEKALRLLCIHHLDFDPSDGEGTLPREVVEMINTRIAALRRAVEFARPYCEVHDPVLFAAALSASSPSEQKSSLPSETLSPQERKHEETDHGNH